MSVRQKIETLLKEGKTPGEIQKSLGYKSPTYIYSVRHEMKNGKTATAKKRGRPLGSKSTQTSAIRDDDFRIVDTLATRIMEDSSVPAIARFWACKALYGTQINS